MKCTICGCNLFIAHQIIRADIIVDENNNFVDNMPDGLEANIYDSDTPYGPYTCYRCGTEYDSPDCESDGSNWRITNLPFDLDRDELYFRANDPKTHKTITIFLQKDKSNRWHYAVYDTTYTRNFVDEIDKGIIKDGSIFPLVIVVDILNNIPEHICPDTYSFEQIYKSEGGTNRCK